MIRKPHLIVLGLAVFTLNQPVQTHSSKASVPNAGMSVHVILRLAEPPVSAIAPPAIPGSPRRSLSRAEVKREQGYCRELKARQERLAQLIETRGARVTARYQIAFNGLCVEAPPTLLGRLATLPGVVSLSRVLPVQRTSSDSLAWLGAPTVWGNLGADGHGIRVAVIDSGIDYTHKDFGGPGTADAYRANDPTVIEPGSFPTAKVVGGYDFVGDDFPNSYPQPDPDPLDPAPNGHGTQVAGIIAGLGVPGKIPPGVAPGALLLAYKVYGRTGGTTQEIVLEALDQAMDPNGDGSVDDHADVINISGGIPRQSPDDPLVIAADNAAQLGAIVVGSAGNDGNQPFVIGGPGIAAGAISVGNVYGGGAIFDALKVNNPSMGNLLAAEGALTAPLTPAGVTADVVYVGSASTGTALLVSPRGRIALADRDGRPFADKVHNSQQAGAIGILVINNSSSGPTTMPGDRTGVTIPGAMIAHDDGTRLKAALAGGQRVNVTLSSQTLLAAPAWADRIDDASSRGPRMGDGLIKPDVVAPGVNVITAAAGAGDGAVPQTGTSAAAPVVAGIAALLRQIHPTWSVAEIKAAIINTAVPVTADGVPYPISRQGAGRVRADVAAATQTVALADDGTPSLSFGFLDQISQPIVRQVTLENKGSSPRQFTFRVDYLTPSDAGGGIDLAASLPDGSGGRIILVPGASVTLNVTLTVHPDLLGSGPPEYGGCLTFTEITGTNELLRVPFLAAYSTPEAEITFVTHRRWFLPERPPGG